MVVPMPPISTAKFIGMRLREAEDLARNAAPTRIGIMSTTIGVSFRMPLKDAHRISTRSIAAPGRAASMRPSRRDAGSSAPVATSPRPRIIRLQIATSASCPKPKKKSTGVRRTPS